MGEQCLGGLYNICINEVIEVFQYHKRISIIKVVTTIMDNDLFDLNCFFAIDDLKHHSTDLVWFWRATHLPMNIMVVKLRAPHIPLPDGRGK